ncbi:ABC transporter substrate-binding protein [Paenibacillus selenitireducens]|uniref:ABC transporter substrate-binding protein n=1 Tax=Paenibacillus selenitireducens TaxID=1324314 RepID=A0A1T2X8P2_9BACL|nr:extracellular solute-binding protein [Paenibacillus selenitireducens]OPA76066.1 ABC transporter substrate-binding protein [Paenibacillus selenitireducens]
MKKRRSLSLMLASVLVLALALSACGGSKTATEEKKPETKTNVETKTPTTEEKKDPAPTPAPEPPKVEDFKVILRHINVRDTAKKTLEQLQNVAKKTEAEVPGLKFELDGVEDTVNRNVKLKAEMQAGTQPPVFSLFGGDDTKNYSKAGRLLALNDILSELGIADSFFSLREFTIDGKVYGLPESGFIEGFFYNKKLFEDAGVQVPKTWDEFLAVCEALKAKGITPIALGAGAGDGWAANMLLNSLFVGLGGPEIQEGFATGKTKWTDAPVVDAMKRLKELKDKGYIDKNVLGLKYAQGQANFYTGKAAMLFDGSWAINAIIGDTSTIKDAAGYFRFPDVGGPGDGYINGGWSSGYGFSATANENEMKAIKAFIKNYFNVEQQKLALVETSRIPAMKGVSDVQGASEIVKSVGEAQGTAKSAFPAFDSLVSTKVKVTLETTVQELLGGKVTPEKAAEKVQKAQDADNAAAK